MKVEVVLSENDSGTLGWMDESDLRRVFGKRAVDVEMVMSVLHGIRMFGGMRLRRNGVAYFNCDEFLLYLECVLNRVIDQEACGFIEEETKVKMQPDTRPVRFELPDYLKDDERLKAARRKAASLNFAERLELEAKKKKRENAKRLREERDEDEAPPVRRGRWSESDEDFAVVIPPDTWEDHVSFPSIFNSLNVTSSWLKEENFVQRRRMT